MDENLTLGQAEQVEQPIGNEGLMVPLDLGTSKARKVRMKAFWVSPELHKQVSELAWELGKSVRRVVESTLRDKLGLESSPDAPK